MMFMQELFEMFVVFDYNTRVSSRALEVIWNKDSIETEELLMGNADFYLTTNVVFCIEYHVHRIRALTPNSNLHY